MPHKRAFSGFLKYRSLSLFLISTIFFLAQQIVEYVVQHLSLENSQMNMRKKTNRSNIFIPTFWNPLSNKLE